MSELREGIERLLELARAEGFADGWRAAHARVRALLDGAPVSAREVAAVAVAPAVAKAVVAKAESAARHAAVTTAAAKMRPRPGRKTPWATAERMALLRELWAAGERSPLEIKRRLAAVSTEIPVPAGASWFYRLVDQQGLRPQRSRQVAAGAPGGVPAPARVAPAEVLAEAMRWAEGIDPDLVLRGAPAERLAQINELRALEGVPPYRLPDAAHAGH